MFRKILIANRGEIALRLVRAVRDLGAASVAVHAQDDAQALHVRHADEALALDATGPRAYLDAASVIAIAKANSCDAIHPGYGFLSERADFAQACAACRPRLHRPDGRAACAVRRQGACARTGPGMRRARDAGQRGSGDPARSARPSSQPRAGMGVMIKAIGGGGGRGMRAVLEASDLPEAYARCTSEAHALRRRWRLRRTADAARAPHRDPGAGRRRPRRGQPGRARMLAAAALSETGGDRAQPDAAPTRCASELTQAALRMAQRRELPQPGHLRIPGGRELDRPALRLHRGQPAPAGRAHGDRRGHRPGPGATADRRGRRADAGAAGPRRQSAPRRAARLCDPVAHQRRDAGRPGQCAPVQRHAGALRPCRPARACASTRMATRASRLAALRHAAGQADRALAPRRASPMRCGARGARWPNAASTGMATNLALAARPGRSGPSSQRRRCTRASWKTHLADLLAASRRERRAAADPGARARRGRWRTDGPDDPARQGPDGRAAGAVRSRGAATCCRPARSSACSRP